MNGMVAFLALDPARRQGPPSVPPGSRPIRRACDADRAGSHLLDVFVGLVRKGPARGKVTSDLADHRLGLAAGAVESLAPMTQ